MELLNENESLRDSRLCLSYLGSFDDQITDKLIGISEYYLKSGAELSKLKNKVSFLIAECFQNIVRHAETTQKPTILENGVSDFFQINVFDTKTTLSSSNLVQQDYIEALEKKILQVNSLDADGLRKLHADVLSNRTFSDKGGAGLGLIEMARKSGLPLKYSFKEVGEGFSRFFLLLEIFCNKSTIEKRIEINEIEDFYYTLTKDEIIMLFKGDLSKDTIIPLLEMVQNNFSDSKKLLNKKNRSIITLIEALQNVSRHGLSTNGIRDGIFTLDKSGESYTITVGNPIEKEKQPAFESHLASLKNMDAVQLKEFGMKKLVDSQLPAVDCGMGLIKIAKNSNGNFQYKFSPYSENSKFFTLKVNM